MPLLPWWRTTEPRQAPVLSRTLLPFPLACVVSSVSRTTTIALRLGTYVSDTVLESSRIGTLTTIDVYKRALESLIWKTEVDVPDGEEWTDFGMTTVHKAATLAQLFTSASFHLASKGITTASNLAQDSVHMIDSIFGSTEASRAIASIITMIRRELGNGAGLYGLVSGLTCFSILQSRGWRRTIERTDMRILWDVIVSDTGETRTLQVQKSRNEFGDEISFLAKIPSDAVATVTTDEVTKKTTTIELIGSDGSSITIPENAIVTEETIRSHEGEKPRYRLQFQTLSRKLNRKNGTGDELNTISTPANVPESPANSTYDRHSENHLRIHTPEATETRTGEVIRPCMEIDAHRSDTELVPEEDVTYCLADLSPSRSHTDKSIHSVNVPVDLLSSSSHSGHRFSSSLKAEQRAKRLNMTIQSIKHPDQVMRLSSYPPTPDHHNRGSSWNLVPTLKDIQHGIDNKEAEMSSPHPQTSTQQLQGQQATAPSLSRTPSGRKRRNSAAYTLRTTQSQTSLVFNTGDELQIQLFPPAHICTNMARYMRFASASYGQSFMRLLGLGIPDRIFPATDAHHAEHHAFASHTGVGLDHILLSSFQDSAIDKSGGIPLVHFVAVDHINKAVVLTIRGTLGLEDVLTDLTCEYEEFEWKGLKYKAHSGMLKSATILQRPTSRVLITIKLALEELGSDYGLVICGHSLGGGVGALLGLLISEPDKDGNFVTSASSTLPSGLKIHCYAFGPPATMSSELRLLTRYLCTSVVYGLDIVPCLSLGVLRDFQNVALAFKEDKEGVVKQIRQRVFSKFASRGAMFDAQDDDYLWSVLEDLRASMSNEKLVPPGEVYHVTTSTIFEAHDGRTRKATRVVGRVINDVDKRFGEPVFGRSIFHHSPVYYERALDVLERGICDGKQDGLL
ncbi:uncharacterized protein V1510DRAFT_358860 [Dipodascopsis tothii]|uniref:uncharacterized protein n=1 Tax=Dipodascopsis tothii TaxID=44089 RepID=UPI0034CE17E8